MESNERRDGKIMVCGEKTNELRRKLNVKKGKMILRKEKGNGKRQMNEFEELLTQH